MKRATLVVTYHGTQIYAITAVPRSGLVDILLRYDGLEPYAYESFRNMYKAVLKIAKHSGYIIGGVDLGYRTAYDILWIDTNNPKHHEQFSIVTSAPSI